MATKQNTEIKPPDSNSENNPKKPIALFGNPSECSYFSCFCEENVYKLIQDVSDRHPSEVEKCYVAFISNNNKTVPLWRQRGGKGDEKVVIWDYHVILLYHPDPSKCLVYDQDSELPFPTYVHKYITETCRTDEIVGPQLYRYFRVVPANEFLKDFASDRRHMKAADGTWLKPPPTYPPIRTATSVHNLEKYVQMDSTKGPGQVYNLINFLKRFYNGPLTLKQS